MTFEDEDTDTKDLTEQLSEFRADTNEFLIHVISPMISRTAEVLEKVLRKDFKDEAIFVSLQEPDQDKKGVLRVTTTTNATEIRERIQKKLTDIGVIIYDEEQDES